MAIEQLRDARGATNPLFNSNRLKLGVFGFNVSRGATITLAEGTFEADWPTVRRIGKLADAAGFEALVPVARWRGFGGPSDFNGSTFETYTWAAGLAEATRYSAVLSTSHVPTVHPIVAAKQATTIDHISGGRFGLNVVCGWYQPELEMFGAKVMEHELRYEYAAEWLDVMRLLWTREDEFDYDGRFFHIKRGVHRPKPIQRPFPGIMNAGGSPTGERFAAQQADMAFTGLPPGDMDAGRAKLDRLREIAREFGRQPQFWTSCSVVCRPTEKEARDYVRYYVEEKGDWEAAGNLVREGIGRNAVLTQEQRERMTYRIVAGYGASMLVGTPEQIADQLVQISGVGVNGCLLLWVNYEEGLQQWNEQVMPLLEQAGLRKPFHPDAARS